MAPTSCASAGCIPPRSAELDQTICRAGGAIERLGADRARVGSAAPGTARIRQVPRSRTCSNCRFLGAAARRAAAAAMPRPDPVLCPAAFWGLFLRFRAGAGAGARKLNDGRVYMAGPRRVAAWPARNCGCMPQGAARRRMPRVPRTGLGRRLSAERRAAAAAAAGMLSGDRPALLLGSACRSRTGMRWPPTQSGRRRPSSSLTARTALACSTGIRTGSRGWRTFTSRT